MVYDDLTPQHVLDALDAVGLRGDGRLLQLNSYENRVFQVYLEDGEAVVAKFYRPGRWSDAQILEEHAFALELAEAEVPVVPPLVLAPGPARANEASGRESAGPSEHPAPGDAGMPGAQAFPPGDASVPGTDAFAPGAVRLLGQPPTLARAGSHRYAAARRFAGREPELDHPGVLQRLGAFIGRLHVVGRRQPFRHRHRLDAAADGRRAIELVLAGGFATAEEATAEIGAWRRAAEAAHACAVAAFSAAASHGGALATLRLHGDCHIGNILWREDTSGSGAHVVDLDDAMQGPAIQDLWMLASGDPAGQARRLEALLEGYEVHCPFDWRERALVEPLRTLRMLRHSAWLAERWADPTFPINFPFFGTAAYWRDQAAQLHGQLELMQA